MKEIQLEKETGTLVAMAQTAQHERVVVTRAGKPVAVLVGIENKDAEDLQLQSSREFWQMIEERRHRPGVPLAQLEAELKAGNLPLCRYSMVIQWSDEDQAFVAALPEFGDQKAWGTSYEEAAINGQELLHSLMETFEADGKGLPEPVKVGESVLM